MFVHLPSKPANKFPGGSVKCQTYVSLPHLITVVWAPPEGQSQDTCRDGDSFPCLMVWEAQKEWVTVAECNSVVLFLSGSQDLWTYRFQDWFFLAGTGLLGLRSWQRGSWGFVDSPELPSICHIVMKVPAPASSQEEDEQASLLLSSNCDY